MVQLNHGLCLLSMFLFLASGVVADKDAKKLDLARRRLVYGVHEEPALVLHADESVREDSFGSFTNDWGDVKDWGDEKDLGRILDSIDTNMSMDCVPYITGLESK